MPIEFSRDNESFTTSDRLPVLPLRDLVLFPYVVIPLLVGRQASLAAVEAAVNADKHLLLVAQKNGEIQEPGADDLYRVGVVARVPPIRRLAERRHVGARSERPSGPGDDDHLQVVVGVQPASRRLQFLQRVRRQRIELVGTVEHDLAARAVNVHSNGVKVHGRGRYRDGGPPLGHPSVGCGYVPEPVTTMPPSLGPSG